jgi:hypothetical protein
MEMRQMAYADWWYDTIDRTHSALSVEELKADDGDLCDFIEVIGSLLTFAPNPRQFSTPIMPPFEADPFGHAFVHIKEALRKAFEHSGAMSEGEYERLKHVDEVVAQALS